MNKFVIILFACIGTAQAFDETNIGKNTMAMAIQQCQNKIKQDAHDPGSVEFTSTLPVAVRETAEGGLATIELTVEIRARNGYNAIRKSAVTCKFFDFGKDDLMIYAAEEVD